MKMTRIIQKLSMFIFCLLRFKNIKLAYYLAYYKLSIKNMDLIDRLGDTIVFKKNKNKIFINHLPNFLFNLDLLFELLNADFVIIENATPTSFFIQIKGLHFHVTSLSNMAVLYEIFLQNIYSIHLQGKELVGIDIGMNIGAASHFFAGYSNVKIIYGYEPFPETYKEAVYISSLNPITANKLVQLNIGVSDCTGEKTITLYESGLLSASTANANNSFGRINGENVTVQLIAIKELLENVMDKHPNHTLFLKIDCEGEEYAIFESLKNTNLFHSINCMLIEWHEEGPEPITEILKLHGFQYLHIPNELLNAGMIYAFK